jgi:DNA-binding response OmpR family regulator
MSIATRARRVLVVEDDRLARRMLFRALAVRGYRVTMVATIAEARAVAASYDIGIIDGELPDGNGVDLAIDLLGRGVIGRAIFFTATDDHELLASASTLGPVVRKDVKRLLEHLDTIG